MERKCPDSVAHSDTVRKSRQAHVERYEDDH